MPKLLWTQKQDFGPKPRTGHAMTFDDARSRVVLFGGDSLQNRLFADTWEWDGENWTQTADTGPSARAALGMAFDNERRQTIVFGGQDSVAVQGDTWAWEGENWTQLADVGAPPRTNHAIVFDSSRKRVVLFGGEGADGSLLDDTWEWDGMAWTQVEDTGPAARAGHMLAYDTARNRTVLFGGVGADGSILGDTWEWAGQAWVQVAEFGATPCRDAAMVFDGKRVALFGGTDPTVVAPGIQVFGNTWEWDGKHWTERQDIGPAPRSRHAMAYDSKRQKMVLFGGLSAGGRDTPNLPEHSLGDTWEHSDSAAGLGGAEGGAVTLASFTIVPPLFLQGQHAQGSITLTGPAPAGGAAVQLTSLSLGLDKYIITPIPPILIPANVTSASFDMRLIPLAVVFGPHPDIIRASLGDVSKDVSITVG